MIIIISGERDSGKTVFCHNLINLLIKQGLIVKGIISPGRYVNGVKVGIDVLDIFEHMQKHLAEFEPGWDPDNLKREWRINDSVLQWGNQVIKKSIPTDLLIVDEIGYQEIEEGKGWTSIFEVIKTGLFKNACIVVRPGLIPKIKQMMTIEKVINLNQVGDIPKKAIQLANQLVRCDVR